MNETNSPLTTTPVSSLNESNNPGRRVSKKALGLLAAAAISAGTIGTVTLMSTPSAADTPAPPTLEHTENEPTNILPIAIEELDTEVPGSIDYASWDTDGHNWDDCPACGMG